jgi:Gram-negative bacterial TonB protein C-terminal/PilZ domain
MSKVQDSQTGSIPGRRELRQHPRRKLAGMAYVELAQDNGGILLNLSEGGLALRSALMLTSQECPELRFQLPNMRGWLTASGRVVWMSESKKEAGIQFLDLHEHARAQVRMWVAKEGTDEPMPAVQAGAGVAADLLSPGAGTSQSGPTNAVQNSWTGQGGTERTAQGFGAQVRRPETPPAQNERSFRLHDYSMFAADANGDVTWMEPAKQRRSWGSYVLFTILLAALCFVLGAMVGRDNLNGLVSSVEGWKGLQGEAPPSAKPPAPPDTAESSTPTNNEEASSADDQSAAGEQPSAQSTQTGNSAENNGQTSANPQQKSPGIMTNGNPSVEGAAAGDSASAIAAPKKVQGSSEPPSISKLRARSIGKAGTPGDRDASDANEGAGDSNQYGRSILVKAPRPGSPPFLFTLPGEAVSASSSVAISARRSVQVPPRADDSGSERLIVGKLLAHSDPFYPVEARNQRIEGIVELQALVGRSGQVVSITPVSGPQVLVVAGVTALHEWRYEPTFINGDPVETHVDVTMVFRSR